VKIKAKVGDLVEFSFKNTRKPHNMVGLLVRHCAFKNGGEYFIVLETTMSCEFVVMDNEINKIYKGKKNAD